MSGGRLPVADHPPDGPGAKNKKNKSKNKKKNPSRKIK
jgi:hypothetical protein